MNVLMDQMKVKTKSSTEIRSSWESIITIKRWTIGGAKKSLKIRNLGKTKTTIKGLEKLKANTLIKINSR